MTKKQKKQKMSKSQYASVTEHIAEIRTRLIRSFVYIIIGFIIAWVFYDFVFSLVASPITPMLKAAGSKFLITGIAEGFILKLEICLIAAFILVSPFVIIEIIMFLLPALTKKEKKVLFAFIIPVFLLFVFGVCFCYYIIPRALSFFLSQNPEGAVFLPNIKESLLFVVRTALFGGLTFELPVVFVLLSILGVLDSKFLLEKWRHVIVVILIFVAVITPTVDAFTMILMSVPLLFLYFVSIGVIYLIERRRVK